MIARHLNHTAVVEFLQPAPAERPSSTSSPKKRIRSDVPIAESAQKVGVAHRLKAIPPSLHQSIQLGSEEEKAAARKALYRSCTCRQQTSRDRCACRASTTQASEACVSTQHESVTHIVHRMVHRYLRLSGRSGLRVR